MTPPNLSNNGQFDAVIIALFNFLIFLNKISKLKKKKHRHYNCLQFSSVFLHCVLLLSSITLHNLVIIVSSMLSIVRFLVPFKTRTDCKVMEEKPSLTVWVLKRFPGCATWYWALWLLPTCEIIVSWHCHECVLELFFKTKFSIFKEWNTPLKCVPVLKRFLWLRTWIFINAFLFIFFFTTKIPKFKKVEAEVDTT